MSSAPSVLIIGAGFGGLCLAMQLKRAGIDSFTILEKGDDLGGTWRDNAYPGAACDVASLLYCFSFERKTDWSRKWAPQPEILEYIRHCARKYELTPHVRLRTEVRSARFDEREAEWVVTTTAGEELRARFLVSATGQLNRPSVPRIAGLEAFAGTQFHSAQWPAGASLDGRRVAIIGNAASAVQIVPAIAPKVSALTVFQRSPNWMVPKGDRAYSPRELWIFRVLPFVAWLYRFWLWLGYEARWPALQGGRLFQWIAERWATGHLEESVADPALRAALRPDYPVGAKRILISDDYYPALQRPNVRLVTAPIDRLVPEGVVTGDGALHTADVVVLATGFESTAFLAPMHVEGTGGRSLADAWKDGAEAYLGITVSGFPNFFILYGPNTNLGHNSILFMLECQSRYVVRCIQRVVSRGARSLDVSPEALRTYSDDVQARLSTMVWARIEASWYKTRTGRITNNWYGPTWRYWLATRFVDFSVYREV